MDDAGQLDGTSFVNVVLVAAHDGRGRYDDAHIKVMSDDARPSCHLTLVQASITHRSEFDLQSPVACRTR